MTNHLKLLFIKLHHSSRNLVSVNAVVRYIFFPISIVYLLKCRHSDPFL